jgi:hypothetical protein
MNGRLVHGESEASLARRDDEGTTLRYFEEEEEDRQRHHLTGVVGERSWSRH